MTDASTHRKDFKVAVVGGGMCGLAVAVGLSQGGVDVDIYEAASRFGEVGAGVGLGPNAIRALKELGVLDAVLAKADRDEPELRSFRYISGYGEHDHIDDYKLGPGDVGLGIYRPAFLEALVHLVDPAKTHFNKRCVALSTPPGSAPRVKLLFSDGTEAEADVVLGADGIRSVVRAFVLGHDAHEGHAGNGATEGTAGAKFTNTTAFRGLVPVQRLKDKGMKVDLSTRPHCWIGRDKHLITFPIKNDTVINVVAFKCDRSVPWGARPLPPGEPWVTPRTQSELLATYAGWGRDAVLLLECLETPSAWSIHAVDPPLGSYVRGRVALLGDAAHGMLPHLGAGAGQAIEDALVLARLLAHRETTAHNIESVLEAYSLVRQPRANAVLAGSTRAGDIYEGYGPSGFTPEGLRKDLDGYWSFVWHHDLDADIRRAEDWLRENGGFADGAGKGSHANATPIISKY